MPTAARLAGAVTFAFLAWYLTRLLVITLFDGENTGFLSLYNLLVGGLCGWVIMGPRAVGGVVASINGGIITSMALLFWGLIIYSLDEMLVRALQKKYDGPIEAVINIIQLAVDYGIKVSTPEFIAILFIGGAMGGLFSGWVARRWS